MIKINIRVKFIPQSAAMGYEKKRDLLITTGGI